MNLSELKTAHAAAGRRYAAAIEQLHEAYVEVAGLDLALMNGGIGHDGAMDVRSFNHLPQNAENFAHPVFASIDASQCWRNEVNARRDQLLHSFSK